MHRRVVDIADLHDQRVTKNRPLHGHLTRKMPGPLMLPKPCPSLHGFAGVPERHAAGDLPQRIEAKDDADLTTERRDLEPAAPAAPASWRGATDNGGGRDAGSADESGGLPAQGDVGHTP